MPLPKHEPTLKDRAIVGAMCAYGVPETDIAVVIGISPKTLRKYYRQELDTAAAKANARVAERLFKVATEGVGKEAVTAMIFWLKTRARWHETSRHEHSGPEGAAIPVQIKHKVDLSGLSDDQLAALEAAFGESEPQAASD